MTKNYLRNGFEKAIHADQLPALSRRVFCRSEVKKMNAKLWATICMTAMLCIGAPATAKPDQQHRWKDSPASRLAALALLEELNADLLSHDSATLVLEAWCASHHIAAARHIVA